MRVFVYYNLHKHTWSIRDCKTRRVIGHSKRVVLYDVKPKVSQAGRERVLREGRKNVHAGLEGTLLESHLKWDSEAKPKPITYNPYKYETFVYAKNGKEFTGSFYAILENRTVYV